MVGKEMWIENSANSWHPVFTIRSVRGPALTCPITFRSGIGPLDHISVRT